MKAAAMAAITSSARGISHQRNRRLRGGGRPPSASWSASTIGSVVSGLMVSLAVVVAAILAVVFLAFADQPATALARRRRGPATGPFRARLSAPAQLSPVRMPAGRRGPPPARVLQAGLALPSGRPRTATLTVAAPPVARATTEVPSPVRPPHPLPEM